MTATEARVWASEGDNALDAACARRRLEDRAHPKETISQCRISAVEGRAGGGRDCLVLAF